ncbi:hypothetical protein [Spiroplasma endosymbiont of Melieria omissa]|uniref:hypothetical protein n=1 Tax=Spiroplasma endosymbiont of Melieria omissa TaxID=3139324 RepID=UPI003CCB29D7
MLTNEMFKNKVEPETKNKINKLIENLKNEKLDIKLSTQFSILKDELNNRKNKINK